MALTLLPRRCVEGEAKKHFFVRKVEEEEESNSGISEEDSVDEESGDDLSPASCASRASSRASPRGCEAMLPELFSFEALGEWIISPSVNAFGSLWNHLQERLKVSSCGDIKEFARALSLTSSTALSPTRLKDPLEGIWLGGKRGLFMDHLDEVAFVEVDCRDFSGGHFGDRRARDSHAFRRNINALREFADSIYRARCAGRVVYVHCAQGKNRGPASLIAYLLLHAPSVLSLEEAFFWVRSLRQQARTHSNTFYRELFHICREQGKAIRIQGEPLAGGSV